MRDAFHSPLSRRARKVRRGKSGRVVWRRPAKRSPGAQSEKREASLATGPAGLAPRERARLWRALRPQGRGGGARFFGYFLVASQESISPAGASPGISLRREAPEVGAGGTAIQTAMKTNPTKIGCSVTNLQCVTGEWRRQLPPEYHSPGIRRTHQ